LDLLERYLQSVKTFLPGKQQDDILRELSENILSQIEEREAELGRPLTEAEQEDVIKRHGHPIVVAARYGRRQYLIGPAVFPFYWLTLRAALLIGLTVRFIVAIVVALASATPAHEIIPALLSVPGVVIPIFAWVTVAFAVFEICSSSLNLRIKANWSPRSLPAASKHLRAIPRTDSVFRIIAGVVFILWWQSVAAAPFLVLGPAADFLAPGPIWTTLHWPILTLMAAGAIEAWVDFVRPYLTTVRARVRLGLHAAGFVLWCFVFRASNWVVIKDGVRDPAHYAFVVQIVNQVLFYCWLAALIIAGLQLAWECVRYFRNPLASSLAQHVTDCRGLPLSK